MALRKIVEQGDECLTKVCRPVTKFDRRLHDLLDDMAETLADANGAGLAAPQVGILRRVCLVLDEEAEEYLDGDWFEAEAEGLTARAFCHEIEHLDGHLFVEHIDHFLTEEELKDYLEDEE